MPSAPDSPSTFPRLVGRAVERVEDAALLTGRGRFADDVGERPGTAHAAVLRSPHAHAEIVSLDAAAALSMPEVVTVLTGDGGRRVVPAVHRRGEAADAPLRTCGRSGALHGGAGGGGGGA